MLSAFGQRLSGQSTGNTHASITLGSKVEGRRLKLRVQLRQSAVEALKDVPSSNRSQISRVCDFGYQRMQFKGWQKGLKKARDYFAKLRNR